MGVLYELIGEGYLVATFCGEGEGGRSPGGREEGKGGMRGREGEVKGRWEGESESRMCCVGNQVSHGSVATL